MLQTKTLPYAAVSLANSSGTLVPVSQYISCVEVDLKVFSHPVAYVTVNYVGNNGTQFNTSALHSWQYWPETTPVQITYGRKPFNTSLLCGYVAGHQLVKTSAQQQYQNVTVNSVKYTVIGTTLYMQSTVNYTWRGYTPSSIAQAIAQKHNFRSIVHASTATLGDKVQNMSDFQFLTMLAKEVGYRFYVDNTDLYFVNPKVLLGNTNTANTPTFWRYDTPGLYDTLQSFSPEASTVSQAGGVVATRTTSGVNHNTGAVFTTSSTPTLVSSYNGSVPTPYITTQYTERGSQSSSEASQRTTGISNANLYWVYADCETLGDFRLKPNTLLNLQGTALPSAEAGYWLIDSSSHMVTMPPPTGNQNTSQFFTTMEVGRDQISTATTTSPSYTTPAMTPVPPVLVGSVWRSSNAGANIYVNPGAS